MVLVVGPSPLGGGLSYLPQRSYCGHFTPHSLGGEPASCWNHHRPAGTTAQPPALRRGWDFSVEAAAHNITLREVVDGLGGVSSTVGLSESGDKLAVPSDLAEAAAQLGIAPHPDHADGVAACSPFPPRSPSPLDGSFFHYHHR